VERLSLHQAAIVCTEILCRDPEKPCTSVDLPMYLEAHINRVCDAVIEMKRANSAEQSSPIHTRTPEQQECLDFVQTEFSCVSLLPDTVMRPLSAECVVKTQLGQWRCCFDTAMEQVERALGEVDFSSLEWITTRNKDKILQVYPYFAVDTLDFVSQLFFSPKLVGGLRDYVDVYVNNPYVRLFSQRVAPLYFACIKYFVVNCTTEVAEGAHHCLFRIPNSHGLNSDKQLVLLQLQALLSPFLKPSDAQAQRLFERCVLEGALCEGKAPKLNDHIWMEEADALESLLMETYEKFRQVGRLFSHQFSYRFVRRRQVGRRIPGTLRLHGAHTFLGLLDYPYRE
jgi:hypothetical protein